MSDKTKKHAVMRTKNYHNRKAYFGKDKSLQIASKNCDIIYMSEFKLSEVMNELMHIHAVNIRQLSESLGISQSTLNHWLNNSVPRSVEDSKKLAQFFKVSLHYLYFGSEDENASYISSSEKHFLSKLTSEQGEWQRCELNIKGEDGQPIVLTGFLQALKK